MMPVGNCPSLLIVCVYPLSPLSPLSPASPEDGKNKLNLYKRVVHKCRLSQNGTFGLITNT
jgi:hypothetical protein